MTRGATPRAGRSLLRERDFAFYWLSNLTRVLPAQMIAVAVGWQVFELRQSAFDLGLVGLAEFLPVPLLSLPAGHLADRLTRRSVVVLAVLLGIAVSLVLFALTVRGVDRLWPYLAVAVAVGTINVLGTPAARAMAPELVSPDRVPDAMALRTVANQFGIVAGPVLGGVLFAIEAPLVYSVAAVLYLGALVFLLAMRPHERPDADGEAVARDGFFGGVRFLRRSSIVRGAILLDLFAVLLGGSISLLPLFASEVLGVGTVGLGFLRSAPAVGALAAGIVITRWPPRVRVGRTLLVAVVLFGVSMIVFGLSTSFPLSLVALGVSGLADTISVNVRSTMVALATPDALRGRVNAVETMFIGASNQLGAFESGVAAALIGAIPAVVLGGVATIAVAAVWTRLYPELTGLGSLDELRKYALPGAEAPQAAPPAP